MKYAIQSACGGRAVSTTKQPFADEMIAQLSICPGRSVLSPYPFVISSMSIFCFDPVTSPCIVPGTSSGSPGPSLWNDVKVQDVARAHTMKKTMYQFPYE